MRETQSEAMQHSDLEACMAETALPGLPWRRAVSRDRLAVTVGGLNITEFCDMPIAAELAFRERSTAHASEQDVIAEQHPARDPRPPATSCRAWACEYLTLSRAAATLSGGESQRIRLATQIGSSLMGVLYILDEPSIGLHQRDNDKLLATLQEPARPGQHAHRRRAR